MRCDATTVSGDHAVTDGGLGQFGHSTDDPSRPQINVMMGSLDPLGMPLSTDVRSGERADDGFYLPILDRLRAGLSTKGLLFVGACKRSALESRTSLAGHHDLYLSPLPLTGATAEAMDAWVAEGIAQDEAGELAQIFRTNDRGHEVLAAEGYEFARICCVPESDEEWTERVVVVRSPAHAAHQAARFATRRGHAEQKLAALTPPRGRGKRQITDEAMRVAAIATVLTAHRVAGWLHVDWEKQRARTTQYVGRGRGAASREKQVIEQTRYHLTRIDRQGDHIAALIQRFGWKALVTNAVQERRSLTDAVLCYRNAYRVERLCNRLKSRVHIAPLFVTLNEQIEGLTSLLTLGVRVLTVMEFVLRRSLEKDHATLPGLHPENKQKMPDKPTAERTLKAFLGISLTIIKHTTGEEILRRLTPLARLQEDILQRLGLGASLYRQLEIQGIES